MNSGGNSKCQIALKCFFTQIILHLLQKLLTLYRPYAESGVKATGKAIRKEFQWRCGIPNI